LNAKIHFKSAGTKKDALSTLVSGSFEKKKKKKKKKKITVPFILVARFG
jgi:hypothetical protein